MKMKTKKGTRTRNLRANYGRGEQLPNDHRGREHPLFYLQEGRSGDGGRDYSRAHVERGRERSQQKRSQNELTRYLTTLRLSHISRPLLFSI